MKAWEGVLRGLNRERTSKPRRRGLTMVLDRCQGLAATEDFLELAGEYVDHIKLSFGTSVFLDDGLLRHKIEVIRDRHIEVYPGGTLFEVALFQGVHRQYVRRARDLGFTAVEISDGTLDVPPHLRAEAIRCALDLDLKVFTEVGKKDPNRQPPPAELGEQIVHDLELGVEKVIVEARESGRQVGVYDERGHVLEERLDALLAGLDDTSDVIWEAPLKHQQVYFLQRFGSNVNLGNIRPNGVLGVEALRCGLRWETFHPHVEDRRPQLDLFHDDGAQGGVDG